MGCEAEGEFKTSRTGYIGGNRGVVIDMTSESGSRPKNLVKTLYSTRGETNKDRATVINTLLITKAGTKTTVAESSTRARN